MWEISENLHRADLTVLERGEQETEWMALAEAEIPAAQVVQEETRVGYKSPPVTPESGLSLAARNLPIPGATDDAKRKHLDRSVKIASIAPAAKEAAREAGLGDNQSALLAIAKVAPEHQAAKVAEIVKERAEPKHSIATEREEALLAASDILRDARRCVPVSFSA